MPEMPEMPEPTLSWDGQQAARLLAPEVLKAVMCCCCMAWHPQSCRLGNLAPLRANALAPLFLWPQRWRRPSRWQSLHPCQLAHQRAA